MKFKDYLEEINRIVEAHPECLEFDVIYSEDDEGNNYDLVNFKPSLGCYEDGSYETGFDELDNESFNAICVN